MRKFLSLAAVAAAVSAQEEMMQSPPIPEHEKLNIGGLELSNRDDLHNQEKLAQWLQMMFYSEMSYGKDRTDADSQWLMIKKDVYSLIDAATTGTPALALGLGMGLYSYFWWEGPSSLKIDRESCRWASDLIRLSIEHIGCNQMQDLQTFFVNQCHVRWRYIAMIQSEYARALALDFADSKLVAEAYERSNKYFDYMNQLPFFARKPYAQVYDMNFNEDFFPYMVRQPIWKNKDVPITSFLEENYSIIRADLDRIIEDKKYKAMHDETMNAETQFSPKDDDWQTVYLLRGEKWNDSPCKLAKATCDLIANRREIANCPLGHSGAGFLRLAPQGRLKPHFGNAPRLTVHLGLIVPQGSRLRVGNETATWAEGRAMAFDDSFIHEAIHDGTEARYVFIAWMCHPCDNQHLPETIPDPALCEGHKF